MNNSLLTIPKSSSDGFENMATWAFSHSDFLAVCVSLLALIAAVFAGINARRILAVELKREEREYDDRRASQAKLVSCWVETQITHSASDLKVFSDLWGFGYHLAISNSSSQPIYKISARVYVDETLLMEENLASLPPETQDRRVVPSEMLHSALNLEFDVNVLYSSKSEVKKDAIDVSAFVTCEISFTDASGTPWTRAVDGALTMIPT